MNDSTTTQPHKALNDALAMAALGYKIIPIPSGEKFPRGLAKWQERATNDEDQVLSWWGTGEAGIGWAMGLQPNGKILVAIDVDVADGKPGKANFEAFAKEGRFGSTLKATIMSKTGSGGYHFVFETPMPLTNGILLPGVDVRGEGGFIVIPPSIHPNGEQYVWAKPSSSPFEQTPALVPEAIFLKLTEPVAETPRPQLSIVPRETVSRPAGDDASSPADWVRDHLPVASQLAGQAWTYIESKGEDQYWARPGKNPREGHSAILHGEGPLVIWSTTAPLEFWRVGRANPDGSRSLSPFDVYAAIEHAGDLRRASSFVRLNLMDPPPRGQAPTTGTSVVLTEAPVNPSPVGLNLPAEFWEARPWLQHVRDAAWSRLVSPDATLMGVLARFSALVPATLRIPAMVGDDATFDFIGCVVASSSGGKTVSNGVANKLIVTARTDVLLGLPVGSGEGLVQAFMAEEVDDDGKKTGVQAYRNGPRAIHFTVDEGTALMEQQNRKGTTIIQTMCSAWSGAVLGSVGAAKETHRIVPEKKRRVACVINMQTANGHLLLEDHVVAIGLPQRIVFATAHDPALPDDLPEWPGPLWYPQLPVIDIEHQLEYDPRIVSAVRSERRGVVRGNLVLGDTEGHQTLQRLKLAGLMELLDGGDQVSWETWELAGMLVDSSTAIKDRLLEVKKTADEVRVVTQGTQSGLRELAAEDVKERQKIARLADALAAKVPEEGIGINKLMKATTSGDTRHRWQAALDMAIARGAITTDGERLTRT